jgi:tetratricopeptide (TPR) repeat protein
MCALGFFASLWAAGPGASASERVPGGDRGTPDVVALLEAACSAEAASAGRIDSLVALALEPGEGQALKPLYQFLAAEVLRARGRKDESYRLYEGLVQSASRGGVLEASAAKTLAGLAFLRAAAMLDEGSPDPSRASRLLGPAMQTFIREPSRRLFEIPVLLEDELKKRIVRLAWSLKDTTAAVEAFMKYIEVASDSLSDPEDTEIAGLTVSSGLATEGGLSLIRGRRMYDLGKLDEAALLFEAARSGDDPAIKVDAAYELARTRWRAGGSRGEVLSLLAQALEGGTAPDIVQKILFYRARLLNRDGPGRDAEGFLRDMTAIVERFSRGGLADDALYQVARQYEADGDADRALDYYDRLRRYAGTNDWSGSAYYRAALVLYARHKSGDAEEAMRLLRRLLEISPDGDLSLAAGFWLGRMESEEGDSLSARRRFERVIATCPYDYYAVRARMHLNLGVAAAREVWIDPETAAELRLERPGSSSGEGPGVAGGAALQASLESGLYAAAVSLEGRLWEHFPSTRAAEVGVQDLDSAGTFASMGLLLILRKQAIGAFAREGGGERLRLASLAGSEGGDLPLAMLMVFGLDRSVEAQSEAQNAPGFLEVAYPPAYRDIIIQTARADSVPPELLYAVMRRESLFYPSALSNQGAFGLFQFMPATFEGLDKRWSLLSRSGMPSQEAFLRDPGLAIDLGARWLHDELLSHNEGDIPRAVMEHNAGYPAVASWTRAWDAAGLSGDVEYMIESAGFTETRIFTRSVLTDMEIARALGILGADASSGE